MKMYCVAIAWFAKRELEDKRIVVDCTTTASFSVVSSREKDPEGRALKIAEDFHIREGGTLNKRLGGHNVHEVKFWWLVKSIAKALLP
jgi:hypothetical protein